MTVIECHRDFVYADRVKFQVESVKYYFCKRRESDIANQKPSLGTGFTTSISVEHITEPSYLEKLAAQFSIIAEETSREVSPLCDTLPLHETIVAAVRNYPSEFLDKAVREVRRSLDYGGY